MHCEFLLLTLFGSLLSRKNWILAFQNPTNTSSSFCSMCRPKYVKISYIWIHQLHSKDNSSGSISTHSAIFRPTRSHVVVHAFKEPLLLDSRWTPHPRQNDVELPRISSIIIDLCWYHQTKRYSRTAHHARGGMMVWVPQAASIIISGTSQNFSKVFFSSSEGWQSYHLHASSWASHAPKA